MIANENVRDYDGDIQPRFVCTDGLPTFVSPNLLRDYVFTSSRLLQNETIFISPTFKERMASLLSNDFLISHLEIDSHMTEFTVLHVFVLMSMLRVGYRYMVSFCFSMCDFLSIDMHYPIGACSSFSYLDTK